MKKLILVYITIACITNANKAQAAQTEKPKAVRCIWKPNRKASEMTNQEKQIAGFLTFFDASDNKIITVDYNPLTSTARYTRPTKKPGAHLSLIDRENVEIAFWSNPLRKIGTDLNIDVSKMDQTECNAAIQEWLQGQEQEQKQEPSRCILM